MDRVSWEAMTSADFNWLTKAVVENTYGWTGANVYERICQGTATFWRLPAGCIITEFGTAPKGQFLYVTWMAGKGFIKNIDEVVKVLTKYGRACGCFQAILEFNRKGWERVYKTAGAEYESTTFRFNLGE